MIERYLRSTLEFPPGHELSRMEKGCQTESPDRGAEKRQHFCLRDAQNRIIALFEATLSAGGYFGYRMYHPDGTRLLERLFRMTYSPGQERLV